MVDVVVVLFLAESTAVGACYRLKGIFSRCILSREGYFPLSCAKTLPKTSSKKACASTCQYDITRAMVRYILYAVGGIKFNVPPRALNSTCQKLRNYNLQKHGAIYGWIIIAAVSDLDYPHPRPPLSPSLIMRPFQRKMGRPRGRVRSLKRK